MRNVIGTIFTLIAKKLSATLAAIVALLILALPLAAAEQFTIAAIDSASVRVPEQIMLEAYRRLDITVNIVKLPPARSIRISNSGQVDAELARVKVDTSVYANLIRVPVAIDIIEGTVFSKRIDIEITDWNSLTPYKVGIRRGVKFTQRGTKGMDVVIANENKQLIKMLDKGRVDVIVLNKRNALAAIKELGISDIKMMQPSIHYLEVYHYLHKKNQNLLPRLTQVLHEMTANGEIERIMQQSHNK